MRRTLTIVAALLCVGSCSDPTAPSGVEYDILFDGLTGPGEPKLFRVPPEGGEPVLIGGGISARHVTSSADGRTLVFHVLDASGNSELRILTHGMSAPVPFQGAPGVLDREAVWAPDGDRIAFVSHRDDDYGDVFVANVAGTSLTGVTNLTASISGPDVAAAWSPDGQLIAFTSYRTGFPSIWIMNADGSDPRLVSEGTNDYSDVFPSWSPDGNSLAFQRIGTAASRIGIVPRAGGTPTFFDLAGRNYSPAWSPDGRYIAVAADDGELKVLTSDGQLIRRVARAGDDRSPSWIRRDAPWD
jgi:Tol biopolymer transport system component